MVFRLLGRASVVAAAWVVLSAAALEVNAPLADAARRGDVTRVRQLLASRADVNAAMGDGMTALHWAADRGDAVMADLLVKARAKLTATTRLGNHTPLHVAARKGNAAVVKVLLKAGADPKAIAVNDITALHLAAAAGDPETVKALLDAKADPNAREGEWQQTPLMFAAAANRADAIKVLVTYKADAAIRTKLVDLQDEEKRERAASTKRNEELFAALPEKVRDSLRAAAARTPAPQRPGAPAAAAAAPGTPPPAPPPGAPAANTQAQQAQGTGGMPAIFNRDAPPTTGLTASQIQQAIAAGRQAYLSGATATGPEAPVDTSLGEVAGFTGSVGKMGGMTALHHAVRQGNMAAALALLDAGADINQVSTSDSTTPVLHAALNGHFDLAMELVKRGADVKIASVHGTTPLYAAINSTYLPRSRYPQPQSIQVQKTSHLELMEAVLKAGADVNVRLKKNLWFFGYSNCGNGNCGLEYLDGTTAFWRAAYAVDVEAMRLLKKYGADHTIPSFRQVAARGARGGAGGPPGAPGAPAAAGAARPDSSTAGRLAAVRAQLAQGGGGGGFGGAPRMTPEMDSASKAVPPGIGVYAIHNAAGVGYGNGFAGNAHRHYPEGWMPTMKYLVEELGMDVNMRDNNGYTAMHHAASRGDNEMIQYLVSKGGDVKAVSRNGRTTVDMANGPVQRLRPFPETIALLEKLGAKNNHNCVGC
ncbi:MAG: ankyrin repeat domain-containing protein [Gemmatimonadetes bacterium]|nr:ankyrin repeat domain-containing protein [Gemmatimonadota bacterium]